MLTDPPLVSTDSAVAADPGAGSTVKGRGSGAGAGGGR